MARKDYTDSLGRTWTWNEEAGKYDYVRKTPAITTVKGFEAAIREVKVEIEAVEVDIHLETATKEEKALARAKKYRLMKKQANLEGMLAELQAANKKKSKKAKIAEAAIA